LFLFNIFLYIPLLTRRYYRFRSTFYSRLDRLFYDENGQAKITILNFMENGRLSNNNSVTYFYSFFVFLSSGHALSHNLNCIYFTYRNTSYFSLSPTTTYVNAFCDLTSL